VTSGPLTHDDLQAVWRDVTDEGYWRPFVESPNAPIEAIDQSVAQFARASLAVDRTTQSLFILPWSGQTDDPATGDAMAIVLLRIIRTTEMHRCLVFEVGQLVHHVTDDYGETGAQPVRTGRRYALLERRALLPGETTVDVWARAERPGTGYNQPLPGTIQALNQASTGGENTGRAVGIDTQFTVSTGSGPQLDPGHVNCYIALKSGPMAGQLRQIRRFVGGYPVVVELDRYVVFRGSGAWGTFRAGERVFQAITGMGDLVAVTASYLVIDVAVGYAFSVGAGLILGSQSGAAFTPDDAIQQIAVTGSAAWQVQDWTTDLGVSVTNPESPTGGKAAVLDELGAERNVPRTTAEPDESFRIRVANPADVVTPNAIRRAANHILAPYGLACCFRQVGSHLLPGMFCDAGSSRNDPQNTRVNYAFDMPITPQNRNKVMFDIEHFRGWFKVGVPKLNLGNFGCAFDVGTKNACDIQFPTENFYDGFAAGNRKVWVAVWAAVERARMAGVRWDLYVEDIGCF
jgi:hypothetical protein